MQYCFVNIKHIGRPHKTQVSPLLFQTALPCCMLTRRAHRSCGHCQDPKAPSAQWTRASASSLLSHLLYPGSTGSSYNRRTRLQLGSEEWGWPVKQASGKWQWNKTTPRPASSSLKQWSRGIRWGGGVSARYGSPFRSPTPHISRVSCNSLFCPGCLIPASRAFQDIEVPAHLLIEVAGNMGSCVGCWDAISEDGNLSQLIQPKLSTEEA